MKGFVILLILLLHLASPSAWAAKNGFCLPKMDAEDLEDWPICAVYLHGLFGAPPYSSSTWEVPFRAKLQKVAMAKHCRIAVPFGNQGKYRNWNGVSLKEIRARAREVCLQAPFADEPDIIGFSNGANRLRRIGLSGCENLARFAKVTLIGPTGVSGNAQLKKCGNVQIHQAHEVPSLAYLMEAVSFEPPAETINVSRRSLR